MLRASLGGLRKNKKKHRPDYRQKLSEGTPTYQREDRTGGRAAKPVSQVRMLATHPDAGTLAFQSVLVAALTATNRVLKSERQAAGAAISLAQREKLHEMVQVVEQTMEALLDMLTPQGKKMLDMSPSTSQGDSNESSWWFALTEAQRANAESVDWMQSVVVGQPREGLARTLSQILTDLFQQHDTMFLGEAEQWIN